MESLRESFNMSRNDLAKKTGLSRMTIWKYETGRIREGKPSVRRAIADGLGVTEDIIFCDKRLLK